MENELVLQLLAALLILIGLAGILVPALPGLPVVFAGMLLSAWAGDFQQIGLHTVFLLGFLTIVALIADFAAAALGAKRVGASRLAIIGAFLGTVAGLFTAPWGLLIGPFAGAVIGEYLQQQELHQATRVGLHTWLGLLIGVGIKLALAFTMLGIFAFSYLF